MCQVSTACSSCRSSTSASRLSPLLVHALEKPVETVPDEGTDVRTDPGLNLEVIKPETDMHNKIFKICRAVQ